MVPENERFDQNVEQQIALNRSRTPTERLLALCDLLDTARAMAPLDPAAQARRLRVIADRQRDREQLRARLRQFLAARRVDAATGI